MLPHFLISSQNLSNFLSLLFFQIKGEQVEDFKPGQVLARCRLLLKRSASKDPPEFEHRLEMVGAKKPNNFVTILSEPIAPDSFYDD